VGLLIKIKLGFDSNCSKNAVKMKKASLFLEVVAKMLIKRKAKSNPLIPKEGKCGD